VWGKAKGKTITDVAWIWPTHDLEDATVVLLGRLPSSQIREIRPAPLKNK
jgi:hypothetical protein